MINKQTKDMSPVAEFINVPQFVQDIRRVTDSGRGKLASNVQMALALLKNYNPAKAPKDFSMFDLLKKFDKSFSLSGKSYGKGTARRNDPWNFLFVAGMWFQDLFNYDFRRTEMCVIPYGTQEGEISFCAYNTGIGWRNIIEKMHMTATLSNWYGEHGRHKIYAGGRKVGRDHPPKREAAQSTPSMRPAERKFPRVRRMPAKRRSRRVTRSSKRRRPAATRCLPAAPRDRKLSAEEEARLMKMYRQEVLKEPVAPALVQIGGHPRRRARRSAPAATSASARLRGGVSAGPRGSACEEGFARLATRRLRRNRYAVTLLRIEPSRMIVSSRLGPVDTPPISISRRSSKNAM